MYVRYFWDRTQYTHYSGCPYSWGARKVGFHCIIGAPQSAPEGIWVSGGGIEIPCKCVLHGRRKDSNSIRQVLLGARKSWKRKAEE